MSRLPMLLRDELGDLEPLFARVEAQGGTVPNAWRIMGHVPGILRAFTELAFQTLRVQRKVDPVLKWLVAHVTSRAAGSTSRIGCSARTSASTPQFPIKPHCTA